MELVINLNYVALFYWVGGAGDVVLQEEAIISSKSHATYDCLTPIYIVSCIDLQTRVHLNHYNRKCQHDPEMSIALYAFTLNPPPITA